MGQALDTVSLPDSGKPEYKLAIAVTPRSDRGKYNIRLVLRVPPMLGFYDNENTVDNSGESIHFVYAEDMNKYTKLNLNSASELLIRTLMRPSGPNISEMAVPSKLPWLRSRREFPKFTVTPSDMFRRILVIKYGEESIDRFGEYLGDGGRIDDLLNGLGIAEYNKWRARFETASEEATRVYNKLGIREFYVPEI